MRDLKRIPPDVDTTDGSAYIYLVWAAVGAVGLASVVVTVWLVGKFL